LPTRSVRAFSTGCSRPVLLMIAALAMTASGCGMKPTRAVRVEPPREELLAPCLRPPPAENDRGKTLVDNHVKAMGLLDDCAIRQAELAQWAQAVSKPPMKTRWWWQWKP
jgi:hypothetical protein